MLEYENKVHRADQLVPLAAQAVLCVYARRVHSEQFCLISEEGPITPLSSSGSPPTFSGPNERNLYWAPTTYQGPFLDETKEPHVDQS